MRDQVVDGLNASAEDARRLHAVEDACRRLFAPAEPGRTPEDIRGWLLHPLGWQRRRLWLCTDADGTVVAAAWLAARTGGVAWGDVRVVPGARGTGIGTRLLATMSAYARESATQVLLGLCDDEGSVRFLTRHGGRPGRSFVRQVLELGTAAGAEEAGSADGLTVVSWETVPDALLDSYTVARNAMNDAPADEAETMEWTAADVRDLERSVAARDRELHVTALLDGDRVAAYTELRVSREPNAVAFTEDTAVLPAYRGRGLAKRVKAASLRKLAERRPDVRRVTTTNEVSNAPMLAVNRAAGFVPVATRRQVRLDLPAGE